MTEISERNEPRTKEQTDRASGLTGSLPLRLLYESKIKYICDQANLRYTVDNTAVVLSLVNEVAGKPAAAAVDEKATAIQNKLNSIIIPRVDFENVTLDKALDLLRQRARELDVKENDPAKRGINFVIKTLPAAAKPQALKIREMRLRNVPLGTVIEHLRPNQSPLHCERHRRDPFTQE